MRKDNIAVIGDKDSVLLYKAIGINAYPVTDEAEARDKLKALAMNYRVIYIVDTFAEKMTDLLARYKTRPFPAVIPVPSVNGSNGFGMQSVRNDVEKAIGTDILFGSDKKD